MSCFWLSFSHVIIVLTQPNGPLSGATVNKMFKFNMERVKVMLSANAMLSEL